MSNFCCGFSAAMWIAIAAWYGYTYSLTAAVFPIQGWIGATLPVLFGLVGALHVAVYRSR